jgi:hypothetical protein
MHRFPKSVVAVALAAPAPTRADPITLVAACHGRDGSIAAMENEYVEGTGRGPCWFHLGHHTYDLGRTYRLISARGSVFTVEIELSAPQEYPGTPPQTALVFEGSIDGIEWTSLGAIPYDITEDRQPAPSNVDGRGAIVRYLRVRQPRSVAQGLSGFLDSSGFEAVVEPEGEAAPAGIQGARALTCASDAMERMFTEHPCWFGGINRYDSPSVFHTYPIGASSLERVRGSATLLPWRTDDYHLRGGSRTNIAVLVQISTDGIHWTTQGILGGAYGLPIEFDLYGLGGVAASYVRLVGEYHTGARLPNEPSLKHVRGMLLDSSLEITAV